MHSNVDMVICPQNLFNILWTFPHTCEHVGSLSVSITIWYEPRLLHRWCSTTSHCQVGVATQFPFNDWLQILDTAFPELLTLCFCIKLAAWHLSNSSHTMTWSNPTVSMNQGIWQRWSVARVKIIIARELVYLLDCYILMKTLPHSSIARLCLCSRMQFIYLLQKASPFCWVTKTTLRIALYRCGGRGCCGCSMTMSSELLTSRTAF